MRSWEDRAVEMWCDRMAGAGSRWPSTVPEIIRLAIRDALETAQRTIGNMPTLSPEARDSAMRAIRALAIPPWSEAK